MFTSTMSPFSQRNESELYGKQLPLGSLVKHPMIWPFELMAAAMLVAKPAATPRSIGVVLPFGQITAWKITSPAMSPSQQRPRHR